jgi:hypothetical protein
MVDNGKIGMYQEPVKITWEDTKEFLIARTNRNEIKICKKDCSIILRNGIVLKGYKTLDKTKQLVEGLMK